MIETSRLMLRTWKDVDAENYYHINQDPKVIEYLAGPLSRQEVKDFIHNMNQQFEVRGYTLWAVEEKLSGKLIGFIGLNEIKWDAPFAPAVEIGWRLDSAFWSKGYATEGAKAALQYGFNKCNLKEIVAFTVPANTRSIRVMEKLGMERDVKGDFYHTKLPKNHPLSFHILYRKSNETNTEKIINFSELRLAHASIEEEWDKVKHLRHKYFFGRVPIDDPYIWTFKHPEHQHFILYKGDEIIGYAHIQLWPENRAALRIMVVMEPYRNKGIGSEFLKRCEHALRQLKVKKLLAQSTPEAYQFYCNNGYSKMPFNDPDGYKTDPRDMEVGKILK